MIFVLFRIILQTLKICFYDYMKKISLLFVFMAIMSLSASAGGLMTNTNYHIAFDRMFARGATLQLDGAYSNPAGLAWTNEGWQLSFNWQSPRQDRDIETTFPLHQYMYGNDTHLYHGKATAPFVPALFAVYKQGRWALSSMIGIVGSGGFVEYNEGVPMFNVVLASMLASKGVTPDQYNLDSQMKGKQYIYGGQLNFTYRVTDWLSAAVGLRANYYDGYYQGHVIADGHPQFGELAKLQLDVDQKGWGFAPIVSVDYHKGPLTLAAKYEFRTKLNIPNTQNQLEAKMGDKLVAVLSQTDPQTLAAIGTALDTKMAPYKDGVKTRYDMPALLAVAAGYEFTDKLRASVEYHYFDDKHAKMANDRQESLSHGTHEVLAGVEYDINDMFTVSAGGQRTNYGLSDDFQTHTSFACDSWSVGFGGAVNLNEHLRLNVSYFMTLYDDYTKNVPAANPGGYQNTTMAGTDVFSRTNKVFGVGIDYKF